VLCRHLACWCGLCSVAVVFVDVQHQRRDGSVAVMGPDLVEPIAGRDTIAPAVSHRVSGFNTRPVRPSPVVKILRFRKGVGDNAGKAARFSNSKLRGCAVAHHWPMWLPCDPTLKLKLAAVHFINQNHFATSRWFNAPCEWRQTLAMTGFAWLFGMASVLTVACAPVNMQVETVLPLCRTIVPPDAATIRWIAPFSEKDRGHLRSWCDAVGPVVVHEPDRPANRTSQSLIVVSWNMAVGHGDLPKLLGEVSAADANADVLLLVQEAYRSKTPPSRCPRGSGRAFALGLPRAPDSEDIIDFATRTQMYAAYAPSMRNGTDCSAEPREDRGNAILSTLPISDVAVIELPFAQQRRVAIAARIDGLRGVISTHFDTLRGHTRMAEAMAQAVHLLGWKRHFIIAGDFNSALPIDRGQREMKRRFAEVDCGSGPTHQFGRRLDHMFIAQDDVSFPCRTGARRHGSDHRPLIAIVPKHG